MGTILGIAVGVAFATPITAFISTVMHKVTEKASDAELWDGIFSAVQDKTTELAPQIINKTLEATPQVIETFFG